MKRNFSEIEAHVCVCDSGSSIKYGVHKDLYATNFRALVDVQGEYTLQRGSFLVLTLSAPLDLSLSLAHTHNTCRCIICAHGSLVSLAKCQRSDNCLPT